MNRGVHANEDRDSKTKVFVWCSGRHRTRSGGNGTLRVKLPPMSVNVGERTARYGLVLGLAGIGRQWLGLERALGIEDIA